MSKTEEETFQRLMADFAQDQGRRLLELEQDLSPLPEEEQLRLLEAAAQAQKQALKPAAAPAPCWRRRAAAAALVLLIGSGALFGEAGAIQRAIRQLKLEETQRAILFRVETNEPDSLGLNGRYLPSWVPVGYVLEEEETLFDSNFITYKNIDGNFIRFDRYLDSGTLGVDSENAESVENITINGHKGVLVRKNGRWDLNWHDDSAKSFFSVYADNLSKKQIVEFAESIDISS